MGLTDILPFGVGRYRDLAWDFAHNVRTVGDVRIKDLTVVGKNAEHGVDYEPTPASHLHRLLRKVPADYARYSYVDLGSGKGRTLLVASRYPFQSITGVEFGRELHEVAVSNLARFRAWKQRCRDLRAVHADAAEFVFPKTPLVIFMSNPFKELVMKMVAANLERSLLQQPRSMWFVTVTNWTRTDLLARLPGFRHCRSNSYGHFFHAGPADPA